MSVKLVNETWKHHRKRKDLEHSRLFRRRNKHERMLHMMECAPCLNSAIEAVNKFRRQVTGFMEEYEAYGTVGGRLHSHNPFTGGDARTDSTVGGATEAAG